ncbi:SIMPL domain-containing protein [Oceanicoccus sp. KOV_DT_Chl]|uniref:SIMPL domain-containing protein n=1 Tax=Oceanicoccus sp. KOV_DT_Chl TaxID=1904639 RepID=UPI000C7DBC41|nr:SIMPL domain-containing protein [Oceanicoccus sp. KOV_DT_Chl]
MIAQRLLLSFFFYAALLSLTSLSAQAQMALPLPNDPHIVVDGYGFVEAIPDQVQLHFQASATADNFDQAKQTVDTIVGKVFAAASKQNIATDQINAAQISASPLYEWQQKKRVYKGEQVVRHIEITLNDVSRYNDLVDALLATGIERLNSVQLDFQQRQTLQQQALRNALDNARQQADSISQHLGVKIKNVYQVAPLQQQPIMTRMAMSMDRVADSKPVGLVLSKEKIDQQIRVVYLISK